MNNEHEFRQKKAAEHRAETRTENLTEQGAELSAEEILREDMAHVEPPISIAKRLNESISREGPPDSSWWKRLFGS